MLKNNQCSLDNLNVLYWNKKTKINDKSNNIEGETNINFQICAKWEVNVCRIINYVVHLWPTIVSWTVTNHLAHTDAFSLSLQQTLLENVVAKVEIAHNE